MKHANQVKELCELIDDSFEITHDTIVTWAKFFNIEIHTLDTEGLVPIRLECSSFSMSLDYYWQLEILDHSISQGGLYYYDGNDRLFSGGYSYNSSKQEEFDNQLEVILREWLDKFVKLNPSSEELGLLVVNVIFYLFTDKISIT